MRWSSLPSWARIQAIATLTRADGSYLRAECTGPGRYALDRGAGNRTDGLGLEEVTRAFIGEV